MLNNCHNHYANINGHNMNQNIHLNNEKKFRSYKLINDPLLKKGTAKQYRYDGVVSSKESPIQTIDPRPRVPLLWNMIKEPINLASTRFKIDKNYVGQPPSIEVSITNLNDNINKTFLQDTLKKFDAIEETEIFYHPKTSKHLGLAKVVFMTPSGAKACVSKLNRTSLMGNIINVFFDPFAKKINQIYDTIVNPSSGSNVANDYDNNFIDPNNLDQQTLSRISEFGYDISNNEFGSSFATPTTFENQPTSKQYYDEAQAWKSNSTNSEYDKSPVRESLETRINNFIRFHNPSKFQNDSNQESSFSLPDLLNSNESPFYKKRVQKNIDDSDAILDTPPSPFLSASDYLKWNQFTKEMDGHNADQINVDDIHNNNNENNRKYCRNSETSHVDDDDDDNDSRMSLSSLSSGGKFEEHLGSNNAVYDHLSLIPGLANWNADNGRAAYSNSLFPHYMYQSFVQTNSQPFGHFSGFTSSMLRQLNGSMEKEEEDDHEEEKNFSGDKYKPYRSSKDLMEDLSADISRESTKELKEILRKDICKKIVESFSFKLFDQWWEESEKKTNDNVLPNLDGVANDQSSRTEINIPFFNHPNFERSIQNIQSTLTPSFEYGVSRGLRAAMGKMPSFKKKKPKSPNRVIDDKLSDISDEDIDREKYLQLHRRRRRRRPPPHSRSDRSVSSDSRHRSLSSSSSSTSSSLSSQSHSSPSSSQSHSSPSSSSAGNSSEFSSSDEDEDSYYLPDSYSEEGSGSELDSDASSTSLSKSSLSSLVSKKSVSSSKSFTGPLTAINDLPNDTEQKLKQNIFDSDTSSTFTADETIEELKKFNNETSSTNNGLFDESINDMHLKEVEASHALISLADSICPNETDAFDSEQSLNNRLTIDGTDLVHNDHDYCRPPQSQLSSTSETKETPFFVPNKVKNVDNKQRKRKVNTKKSSVLLPPDVNGFLPVASELRKAKYKALGFKTNNDNFDLDRQINNENQAPLIQVITPIKFKARDQKTEKEIVFEFQKNGIDLEDIGYLKRRYKQLLQEENNTSDLSWINDVHWVDHPATYLPTPLPRKRRKLDDPLSREHKTGCARSEGYYKLDRMEKMKHFANAPISCIGMEDDNLPVARQIATTQQMTRDARINQRRLQMMVEQHYNITTDFLKMNKLEFRTKKVKFARSKIHHWGLFAMEKIRPDEMVIEYIGQQIRPMMADWREKRYGAGSSYFFKIDSDTIIDATNSGNVARFINHSCSPNCYAKVITVQGQKRIVIYSKQTIDVGHEITYDYKFPIENDKIPCLCRTPGCRGFLN